MTRRFNSPEAWRDLILRRQLGRDDRVQVERDDLPVTEFRAGDVPELAELFDEADPPRPPPPPAPEPARAGQAAPPEPPAEIEAVARAAVPPTEAAVSARPGPAGADAAAPVDLLPAARAAGPTATINPQAARAQPTSPLPWLVGGGALIGATLLVAMLWHRGGSNPPVPTRMLPSPVPEHVASIGLNVRTQPGPDTPLAQTQALAQGDVVTVYGVADSPDGGQWLYVRLASGVYGYLNAKYLVEGVPSTAPAETAASATPVQDASPAPAATATQPAAPLPEPTAQSPDAAQVARDRTFAYVAAWSEPDTLGLAALRQYYADPLMFYGSLRPLDTVMAAKQQYAQRWPVRSYTIRPASVSVACAGVQVCTVEGIEDWNVSSPARGATSVGVASFVFEFRNGLIDSESGQVLSRQTSPQVTP